jgi:hypothetical protein
MRVVSALAALIDAVTAIAKPATTAAKRFKK